MRKSTRKKKLVCCLPFVYEIVNESEYFSNSSFSVILESDPQQVVHRVALRVSTLFLFVTEQFKIICRLCRFSIQYNYYFRGMMCL